MESSSFIGERSLPACKRERERYGWQKRNFYRNGGHVSRRIEKEKKSVESFFFFLFLFTYFIKINIYNILKMTILPLTSD